MLPHNCTYYYFKTTGKWAYEGRGYLPSDFLLDLPMGTYFAVNHDTIYQSNGNTYPGITGDGKFYTILAIPDEDTEQIEQCYPHLILSPYVKMVNK